MRKFLQELRRRSVYTVGGAYVVAGWLALQVADLVLPIYKAPEWILPAFATLLFLGFPVALLLAWAYEITPQGVVRTESGQGDGSDTSDDAILALPPGPTITVLPFRNLSGDTDQEMMAQAITGDIVSGLTQCSTLRVVACGGDGDAASVGRQLGVRYVLQGSVNNVAEQLRVTAQLTDTASNTQIWSASYDNSLTAGNLFDVQDNIREQIVATIGDFHGIIYSSETEKNVHRGTDSLNAYECLSVALAYDKYLSEPYHLRARESLEKAVELDPEFDQAWSHLSWIYTDEKVFGYNPLPDSMTRAFEAARRAVELAPANYHSHWLLSRVHYFSGNRDLFFAEAEKSLALNANDGTTLGLIGGYMLLAGEWDRGAALIEKAKVLNPKHPDYYHWFLSAAKFHDQDFEGALRHLNRMVFTDWPPVLIFLVAANFLNGNEDDAARHLRALRDKLGNPTLEDLREQLTRMIPYADDLVSTVMQGLIPMMSDRDPGTAAPEAEP